MTLRVSSHSAMLLPYHIDSHGELHVLLERKSPEFKAPYFNDGLNLLGGNSCPQDKSSLQLLDRELREEFWLTQEEEETNEALFGTAQATATAHPKPTRHQRALANELYHLIAQPDTHIYAGTEIVEFRPPLVRAPTLVTGTTYLYQLDANEIADIRKITQELNGTVRTDDYAFGGKTQVLRYGADGLANEKYAWSGGLTLQHLFMNGHLPTPKQGGVQLRDLPISWGTIHHLDNIDDPAKEDFMKLGYEFEAKSW